MRYKVRARYFIVVRIMLDKEILDYIKVYADTSHGDQVRKYTGERYIGHPIRVMETVREFHPELPVLAAALLHDVLEDTPVTPNEMEAALLKVLNGKQTARTMQIVIELTDIFIKKDYPRLNRRTRKEKEALRLSAISPEAQSVKYADIIDNVTDIVKQDADFAKVFVSEAKKMLTSMVSGNPELRDRALSLVDTCLQSLRKTADSY